jgi:GntR family transcriptional regulator/MocR family aminotransferase
VRVGGPPRPFRIGTPGLDLFPVRLWGQLVQRRLRTVSPAQLDYGESSGILELRQGIAEQVSRSRGTRCTAEQVIVTAGAQRGLELIARLLLDPGDTVWMEEPGYPGAHNAFLGAEAHIRPVRVDDEGLDVEEAARRGQPARLVYLSPSHQFPLGVPMSLPRRLALLRWASAARAWVIEDDYDSEFRYGARAIPCLHGLDGDGRVIYVGTFAKTLFPALRLGFLIVPPDLRDRMVAARRATDLHPPALDQGVLADFIDGGHYERHLRRMRSAYAERLEALHAAAERSCAGALALRPVQTGLHVVADLTDRKGPSAERVFEEAAARGVEVMPLSAYYYRRRRPGEKSAPPNALLLGFAPVRPAALRRGMEQLAAAIEAAARGR